MSPRFFRESPQGSDGQPGPAAETPKTDQRLVRAALRSIRHFDADQMCTFMHRLSLTYIGQYFFFPSLPDQFRPLENVEHGRVLLEDTPPHDLLIAWYKNSSLFVMRGISQKVLRSMKPEELRKHVRDLRAKLKGSVTVDPHVLELFGTLLKTAEGQAGVRDQVLETLTTNAADQIVAPQGSPPTAPAMEHE